MNELGGDYKGSNLVLPNAATNSYATGDGGIQTLIPSADTSSWYKRNYGCLRTDPTKVMRLHSFPDAVIPRGTPQDPAAPSRVCGDTLCNTPLTTAGVGCIQYRSAWPQNIVDPNPMIETEMNHPQFAFRPGGPGTPYQIDVESQLRRLDQPLGRCQAIIADDAPLYRNTVEPPAVSGIPENVQNASNPVAAMIRSIGAEQCRIDADKVATSMSGRFFSNPTRQDTMRFDLPFAPPGIGRGSARPRQPAVAGVAFYS
jgi:hypothetical protein